MKKPNILFIMTDDQGAWAMACAGNSEIKTPNLDRIASQGMRFENFFCVSPVCSPARASLLTGDIPSSHGVHDWIRSGSVAREEYDGLEDRGIDRGFESEDFPINYLEGRTTYTDILAKEGYNCALSGKWHLGNSMESQHGFKYWYTMGRGGCPYFFPDIIEDGKLDIKEEYITNLFTNKAIEFIDELSELDDPFYLSLHYTAPHSPWEAEHHPDEFLDIYKDCEFLSTPNIPDHKDITTGKTYGTPRREESLRGYFAAITAMDYDVGRVLDKLEEKGILEDTIIIFTSDNGMNMGHHGIWGKGNGTFPFNMFDTSIKVPFLISYPKLIGKDQVNVKMVSAYDFFPTLMDILAIETDATEGLPGKSFYNSLINKEDSAENPIVVFDEYGPVRMIRTREYKYIHRYPYGPNEFYDLVNDPEENSNLIDDESYSLKIMDLRKNLEEWFIRYVDPNLDGTREGVTGLGQLSKAGTRAEKLIKYAEE